MNIKEAFLLTKQQLEKAGIDDPAFDTIYLFEHVFSMSRTDITIHGDNTADEDKLRALNECVSRRISGEPVQYIIGKWYFMGNTYKVAQGVLIPRDDTEVVTSACLDFLSENSCKTALDLCSGSGIIAVTLKKRFPDLCVYAVEKSDKAYPYLEQNCSLNQADVQTIHSDLYDCVDRFEDGSLDLIVSNPPYIITSEIDTLQREVRHEPTLALDGGEDGFDFYRGIINTYSKKLRPNGMLAFELGENQFEYVSKLLTDAGFASVKGHLDLGGTYRAVCAIYNP